MQLPSIRQAAHQVNTAAAAKMELIMKRGKKQHTACQNQKPVQCTAQDLRKRRDLGSLLQHPLPCQWILPKQSASGIPVIQHKAQAVERGTEASHGKIGQFR
ncbi:hypothetical protein B5F35_13085 [Anaeromassilibacillus sp. An200]|nr:hypothetical protein B5F35_13085 [Anaeromassilibacillus sp. An200]